VFGAVIGSFLNVCVYRIPRDMSIVSPRSHCPACGTVLKASELVPLVSYAALRGRCGTCRERIPLRDPLVEALCGALWAFLFLRYGFSFSFFCDAVFFSILLAVFFIDVEWLRIPNPLVLCAMLPAAAAFGRHALASPLLRLRGGYQSAHPLAPLLGLIPGAALFLLIYLCALLIYRNNRVIGMGDIKLMIPVGLRLGLWQCLLAVFLAVSLGALTGIVLILAGKKKRRDPIQFGPFIVIGAFAAPLLPIWTFA
jgi:leader peptidase (prepilin peptidase)/N-methyltransferase